MEDLEGLIGLAPFGDVGRRARVPGVGVGLAYN